MSGSFDPTMRFENSAIHQVFRNFQNFCWLKISRPKPQKVVFRSRQMLRKLWINRRPLSGKSFAVSSCRFIQSFLNSALKQDIRWLHMERWHRHEENLPQDDSTLRLICREACRFKSCRPHHNVWLISLLGLWGYTFNNRKEIKLQVVTDFYSLVTSLPPAKRKLIFANIYTRLAMIKVVMDDPDLPF